MTESVSVPTFDALMNPLLEALESLGGSASVEETVNKVAELVGLTEAQLEVPHGETKGSEFAYRLAWTRTYLKAYGLLDNSSRGVWSLTAMGKQTGRVEPRDVVRAVAAMTRKPRDSIAPQVASYEAGPPVSTWQDELLATLQSMPPPAFERLAQRILRESGFIQVEVTGRSGDGGIDGKGILRLGGLLSFHVNFQCKRWKDVVGPATIREFRGAMMGRADKGLIITTGTFTKDAVREATRDGAPAIDLVDGQDLVARLKELGLGVRTTRVEVEDVTVDTDWFSSI